MHMHALLHPPASALPSGPLNGPRRPRIRARRSRNRVLQRRAQPLPVVAGETDHTVAQGSQLRLTLMQQQVGVLQQRRSRGVIITHQPVYIGFP